MQSLGHDIERESKDSDDRLLRSTVHTGTRSFGYKFYHHICTYIHALCFVSSKIMNTTLFGLMELIVFLVIIGND